MKIIVLILGIVFSMSFQNAAVASAAVTKSAAPQTGLRVDRLSIATPRGKRAFRVEIADTAQSRQIGMMWRIDVPRGTGMLFDFKVSQPVTFWMENTLTSLDIIFIRADGTIANIAANATPLSQALLASQGPILGVLEIGAGEARRLGITAGQKITHPIFRSANPRS